MTPAELDASRVQHGFPQGAHQALIANLTTPVMPAARLGNLRVLQALPGRQVRINSRKADGNNALGFACISGELGCVDGLLAAGIDLENRNGHGATCLMYTACSGKAAVVARRKVSAP